MEPQWIDLGAVNEIPAADEGGRYVVHETRPYAVWRFADGAVRVMDDTCPHAGASLSAGCFDQETSCVICPLHGWTFHRDHGRCPDNPQISVKVYETRIVEGQVMARL